MILKQKHIIVMSFLRKHWLILGLLTVWTNATAQDLMRVIRSDAVNRDVPIINIFVDEENNKWVSNERGVYKVHAVDLALPAEDAGKHSFLGYPGANFKLELAGEQLRAALGGVLDDDYVTAAFYDETGRELLIGTARSGAFRLRTEPGLQLIEHYDNRNSKLKSNTVNTIYVDKSRRYWIGTDEGALIGREGKFELFEKYFRIQKITGYGSNVWFLSDGEIWRVDSRDELYPLEMKPRMTEGEVKDIAFAPDGALWIASEVITRYDRETGSFSSYGPAQEFTSQFVNCIAVDHDGAAWVGTDDKGLYVIQKASTMTVTLLVDREIGCQGNGADGALAVNVSGGQPPFTYQWAGGLQGERPRNLSPGAYTVTVTDSQGKQQVAEAVLADPRLTAKAVQEQPASPDGGDDAVAAVEVSGGSSDYTYQWDNGETAATARQLSDGPHEVTVTDANGCSTVASVNITRQLAALSATVAPTIDIKCAGEAAGALEVQVSGGKGPYQFQWSDPALNGEAPAGLSAGTYQVTVTDADGNSIVSEVTINAPEALNAGITPVAPASTGNADGQADLKVSGGTAPYTFAWDNGETAQQATTLAPGPHEVTITDAKGCTTTASIEVSENILPLSAAIEQTGTIDCAGQATAALQVSVSGGKGPFQFQWNDPALSGENPTDIAAGSYQLTVTDAEGTAFNAGVDVAAPEALSAVVNPVAPASTGNTDGQAGIQATGGTAPYTFAWDNGETAQQAAALAPGPHEVTVTDAKGCTTTAKIIISEDIQPLVVAIEQTGTIDCAGETSAALQVNVSGGKGPFQYLWSDAALSGEAGDGLKPGEYQLTVTDAAEQVQTAAITIAEPEVLTAEIVSKKAATSNRSTDGKANLQVSGGTAPYSYAWDNEESGASATELPVGEHNVTVTDARGCTTSATVEIGEKIIKELTAGRVRSGQTINIQKLQFDADSTKLDPSSIPVLDEIYEFLDENTSIIVEVAGHTNSLPPPEYCDKLSTARAKAVAEYLVEKGIDPDRVTYVGYGKRKPIFTNRTEDGRRRNQRVEIKILRL